MIHVSVAHKQVSTGVRVTSCDDEPIHTPAAVQPQGGLLVARLHDFAVTHASANIAEWLGLAPAVAFEQPLRKLLGEQTWGNIERALQGKTSEVVQVLAAEAPHASLPFDIVAHILDGSVYVELEAALPGGSEWLAIRQAQTTMQSLHAATSQRELCDVVVSELRALTGYDRVLVYRFNPEGDGEVIAEDCDTETEAYLGHRYPASDIPNQARQLYLSQRVRSIPDVDYNPVPIVANPDLGELPPLDMTLCTLRAVSPTHLTYMRNMGTYASLGVSLVAESSLWGLLVCHHHSARAITATMRAQCDLIGQLTSLLLQRLGEADTFAQRIRRQTGLHSLITSLNGAEPVADMLRASSEKLLSAVDASGALIRLGPRTFMIGMAPALESALKAMAVLRAAADGADLLALDELQECIPDWAAEAAIASGALYLPLLPTTDDAIVWFRPELERTLIWGGDPNKAVVLDRAKGQLTPRSSFAAWSEQVRGHCAPWQDTDRAAAIELRPVIISAIARRAEAELAKLRYYDVLTGLPNRRMFQERLTAQQGKDVALLYIDLDRFKVVNDTHGHAAGDLMLLQVAERLTKIVRAGDLVARIGGDEFVVLCQSVAIVVVEQLAERLRRALEEPFTIAARPFFSGASIGLAHSNATEIADLLSAADGAMYVAKRNGGNQVVVSTAPLRSEVLRSLKLEQDLRLALRAEDQLSVQFQPIFRIVDLQLLGFEALARWHHPRLGDIAPGEFIPIAEKGGLIQALGQFVLRQAIGRAALWHAEYADRAFFMSVNISALQLQQASFIDDVQTMLEEFALRPDRLCLEVTESVLLQSEAISILSVFRQMRVHVAIDDFGIGSSCLAQLRRTPADIIKLDRSFLEDAGERVSDEAFLSAVLQLARTAGPMVIAEGIETSEQLALLRRLGCDAGQGFLLAPPLSPRLAAQRLHTA